MAEPSGPSVLLERLLWTGTIRHPDGTVDRTYDPITHSTEGLDDGCFFCGHDADWKQMHPRQRHYSDCPWIEAMALLGHEHPDHEAIDTPMEDTNG